MEKQITNKEILEELKRLRSDINIIKSKLTDQDTTLTLEEESIIDNAFDEYERGETVSLSNIEKARRNAQSKI